VVTAQGIMDQQELLLVRTTLPHNITCTPIFSLLVIRKGGKSYATYSIFVIRKRGTKPTTGNELPTATTTRHQYTQLKLTKQKWKKLDSEEKH
jgi:hypothetical protein